MNKQEINAIARKVIKQLNMNYQEKSNVLKKELEVEFNNLISAYNEIVNKIFNENPTITQVCIGLNRNTNYVITRNRPNTNDFYLFNNWLSHNAKWNYRFIIPSLQDVIDDIILEQMDDNTINLEQLISKLVKKYE